MGFEIFDKRAAPMKGAPSVTVQKRGIVSINGAAHKMINDALVVELLFDRDRQVMALRPAEPSPRTYVLRAPSKSGQTVLSATAFMDAYGIDTTVSRRYKPFEEDGMLCINFKGPSTEVRGNRSKSKTTSDSDSEASSGLPSSRSNTP